MTYLPADEHWKLKSDRKSSVTAAAVVNSPNGIAALKRTTNEETASPNPPKKINSGGSVDMEDTDFTKIGGSTDINAVPDITDPKGIEAIVS